MTVDNGGELREWRRSRGWDVPELARRLRRAADEPVAAHEGLVRMIRAWERGDHHPSEPRRPPGAEPQHALSQVRLRASRHHRTSRSKNPR